ncbi:hypothetical protein QJS04_geneDACA017828 [Acorus gramineus]|uniref:Calcyclin-binding protein n=1 Tax=Acorus gramineus TaxID=55184 RepID=A0AAV9A3C7_ACOGR|nr:hypothetical protein QJS04_geneDACA017828 [Acorus gramineus]
MAGAEAETSLDLEELRQLQGIAKRPRVLSLISSEIARLDQLLKTATAPVVQKPIKKQPANPLVSYAAVASFSWEQDNDKIKVFLSLEVVDQEKMETVFKLMSVDLKFHDVQGKNYRFSIPKLNKEIVPEKCKVLVKPNRVVVTLYKASKGNWLDLHYKEDKLKPGMDKDKDPMAGIMDLMKNMYEEGDEDMKRTIAKAWSDARSGKASDSMKGFP